MISLDYEMEIYKELASDLPPSPPHPNPEIWVVGIDEVGRGPLAGPVIACSVMINPLTFNKDFMQGVQDSKKLSKKQREFAYHQLIHAIPFALGAASIQEIERLNILKASLLAMERSVTRLSKLYHAPHYALIDGIHKPSLKIPSKTLVKGDSKSFTIAAASIIAKVIRDHLMEKLGKIYPEFDFSNNAGYGVKHHLNALHHQGFTPHHRQGFAPLKNWDLKEYQKKII